MRGPSVYLFGMMWLWGLGLLVGVASLLLLLWLSAFLPLSDDWRSPLALLVWFGLNAGLYLIVPACPRCGLNAFLEIRKHWRPMPGQYLFSRLRRRVWRPNETCSRCGLDLRAHGLFDRGARS